MKVHMLAVVGAAALALSAAPASGQEAGEVILTATSTNVSEPGAPVRIRILRWSTDQDRDRLVAALNPPPVAARGDGAGAGGAAGREGAAGRAAAAGRAGRAGRGGRGAAPAAPVSPLAAITTAISSASTIGFIWTNDATGYAVKYAYRIPQPDGGQRIIIATDRRFGEHAPAWTPVATTGITDYEFTLFELRLGPKGAGEAKTSLTTKVVVDPDAKTVALENYAATPAILQNVKPSATDPRP
jgi:hypothetical protein